MESNNDLIASLVKEDSRFETFADTDVAETKDWLPTLVPAIDNVMLGGIPLTGRITEVFGEPSVGKSTMVGNLIGVAQHMGIIPIYFDIEGTTSRTRLEDLGVDTSHILTLKPEKKRDGTITPVTIEDVFKYMISTLAKIHKARPNQIVLFIWDTVAMTMSNFVANQDVGDQSVGNQARALTEGVRKLNANLIANNGCVIALNQMRADIGGNPTYAKAKTVGGKGWEHELSLRLYMTRNGKVTPNSSDTTEIGHGFKLAFKKSKVGENDGAVANGYLLQESGVDIYYNTFMGAKEAGLIKAGGAYQKYVVLSGDNKGEIISKTTKDWPDYLRSDEGYPVFKEMWQYLLKKEFPECYPALFNSNAKITVEEFPFTEGMQEYYILKQESLVHKNMNYRMWKKDNENVVKKVLKDFTKEAKTKKASVSDDKGDKN